MFDPEYHSQTEEPKKENPEQPAGRGEEPSNKTITQLGQLTLPKPDNDLLNYNWTDRRACGASTPNKTTNMSM